MTQGQRGTGKGKACRHKSPRACEAGVAGRGLCMRLRVELPAGLPVPMNLQPAPPSRPWNLQINPPHTLV